MNACPMCNGPASLECVGGVFTVRCATSCEDAPEVQAKTKGEAEWLWNAEVGVVKWQRLADAAVVRDEAARDRETDRRIDEARGK